MTTLGGPINMVQLTQGLNSSAARLFRIRKTCFALLNKRGYNVPVDDLEMSAETFLARSLQNILNEEVRMFGNFSKAMVYIVVLTVQ